MIEYRDGYAYVDGYKFRKDDKSGYYLSTTNIGSSRIRLHRYIWIKYKGVIPKGYEIHHKDENKDNNDIDNLELLTKKEHLDWHKENTSDEFIKNSISTLEKHARPKAIEWHKSPEGRAWHREHAKNIRKNAKKIKCKCVYCSKEFWTIKYGNKNMFCSRACAAAERRESGKDDEERYCVICKSPFTINKYRKTKTCSRRCSGKLRSLNNKKKASS